MYTLVLVSKSWNGKRRLVVKGRNAAKPVLEAECCRLEGHAERLGTCPDYRVCGPVQLKRLQDEIKAEQTTRRAAGAKKAAATRKKRGPAAFVTCPTCGAKSKKLYSEMGGLETRECQRGHRFEYDRWLAGQAFWAPVLTGRVVPPAAISRPV